MSSDRSASLLGALADLARSRPIQGGVDDMVWQLCSEAAQRLDLPDCVLYLLDSPGGRTLEQRAAYGPKNPREREILDPITIPVDRGIVGSVVATGEPQWVADTSRDPRYIVDDDFRFSELAVPIVHGGEVIGVLDSEHPDKEYFRSEQLDALTLLLGMWSEPLGAAWRQESVATGPWPRQRALGVLQHELRTPLNAVLGYSALLAEESLSTDPEHRRMIASLVDSGRRLEDRLLKLLELPELFSLGPNASPVLLEFDVSELVRRVVDTLEKPYEGVPVRLELPAEYRMVSDAGAVETVIRVLVENALQNTYSGHVTVRLGSGHGRSFRLEVEDTGRGIPSEEIERVFEPFYQAGEGDLLRERGGLGVGLTIAQRLCDRMGYSLEVESVEGSGSLFRVRSTELPAKCAAG